MADQDIKQIVKDKYGKVALKVASGSSSCCGSVSTRESDPVTSNLYTEGETASLPAESVAASLGCGNPTALAELKPGRNLYANVEFYAGVVMEHCGLPRELFSPTFASSRVIGWCANILEQAADNRIIRPSARYVGPPPPQPVPEAEA